MRKIPTMSRQGHLLYPDLLQQLDPAHPLLKLAARIPWVEFEREFASLYSTTGRPAKPVRLMVGLLILKQVENLSDERIIGVWVQNPYYQAFCGMQLFQWKMPCDPSDLVHFRKRIGEKGFELIFKTSVGLHGQKALEKEVVIDTTVQEKNIAYPTDVRLQTKIILRCRKIAVQEGVQLRRSYTRELPKLLRRHYHGKTAKNRKAAKGVKRRIKGISGRLLRELCRKLPVAAQVKHQNFLFLAERVLSQKREDKNKIYSLHEPSVSCIAKGKQHKKYEFGAKASVAKTKTTGIIVGVQSFQGNLYDGDTLVETLRKIEETRGIPASVAICDQGYRGREKIGKTEIVTPNHKKTEQNAYEKRQRKQRLRRRSAIEPVIGHLKADHRMARNYLKDEFGDSINLLMAAAAFNFKKWLNALADLLFFALSWLIARCGLRQDHGTLRTNTSY